MQREAGPTQGVQTRESVEIGRHDRPCFTGPALGVKNGLGAHAMMRIPCLWIC